MVVPHVIRNEVVMQSSGFDAEFGKFQQQIAMARRFEVYEDLDVVAATFNGLDATAAKTFVGYDGTLTKFLGLGFGGSARLGAAGQRTDFAQSSGRGGR